MVKTEDPQPLDVSHEANRWGGTLQQPEFILKKCPSVWTSPRSVWSEKKCWFLKSPLGTGWSKYTWISLELVYFMKRGCIKQLWLFFWGNFVATNSKSTNSAWKHKLPTAVSWSSCQFWPGTIHEKRGCFIPMNYPHTVQAAFQEVVGAY